MRVSGKGIPLENKVIVAVVAALVIGLAAGYLITYVSYQGQLSTLLDEISYLRDSLDNHQSTPTPTPTPSATATPTTSGSPSPTYTPSNLPVQLEVFDQNAGQDGVYYYVNFTVRNSGQVNCTLRWVYLNALSNQALSGISAVFIDGHGHTANGMLDVDLNPGDIVTIKVEGTAGDLTGTIWQPGMSVSIAVDTTSSGAIFTAGSYVNFPG